MDAVEFLREQARMCKSIEDCVGCPLLALNCVRADGVCIEQKVEAVEKWSKEHSVDGQKAKHGKWNYISNCGEIVGNAERVYIKQTFYYQCSECSRQINFEVYDMNKTCALRYANKHFPYCHCGAKMDGDEK